MLILVNPMFSRTAINADSCYNVIRSFIEHAVRVRDDIFFDVLWPSNGKDWSYYKDGLFDHAKVRRLPMRFHPSKMKQVVSFAPFEIGDYLDYKVPYDVIWNHAPEIGDLLKHNVASYNPSGKSALVNAHHYVIHKSLPYPVELDQSHVMLRQLVGSFNVDAHVFDSAHCREMFVDNCEQYLSPYATTKIMAHAHMIPHGCLDRRELAPYLDTAKDEVFAFAYNHRLQHYKNYKTTFALFEQLHNEGAQFKVVVFGMPGDQMQMSWVSKFPFVEMFVSQTRAAYLAKLATCHANVLHSQHETFCLSAVESMAFGQTVIAPNGVTFPEITGAATNAYPFLFDKDVDALPMMREVIADRDVWARWAFTARDHVWATYNVETWATRYLDLFDQVIGEHDVVGALKNPEPMIALVTSKRTWEFQELRREVYQLHVDGKLMASAQSFPANRIKRMMHQLGYRDDRAPRTGDLLLTRRNSV